MAPCPHLAIERPARSFVPGSPGAFLARKGRLLLCWPQGTCGYHPVPGWMDTRAGAIGLVLATLILLGCTSSPSPNDGKETHSYFHISGYQNFAPDALELQAPQSFFGQPLAELVKARIEPDRKDETFRLRIPCVDRENAWLVVEARNRDNTTYGRYVGTFLAAEDYNGMAVTCTGPLPAKRLVVCDEAEGKLSIALPSQYPANPEEWCP